MENIIYQEFQLLRKKPINLIHSDQYLFESEFQKKIKKSIYYKYNNAIVTYDGIIIKNLTVVNRSLPFSNTHFTNFKYLLHTFLKKTKIKSDDTKLYILTFDCWATGYFHFITDCLTRLIECEKHFKNAYFIFPENFGNGIFKTIIDSFGISNIIYLQKNQHIKIANLLAPSPIAESGNYNPINIKKLVNHLTIKLGNKSNKTFEQHEYIYISRAKATYRFLTNEIEVQDVLKSYGFKVICFEDHSFEEQMEICRNAKFMVSSHGANLTNCIFMKEGGNLLELRKKDDYHNNCYYSLANAVGLNYFYQTCDYIDRRKGNYFDLTVNISILRQNIQLMINK